MARGAMDHIVWMTMTREGPKIVNPHMSGVMDKTGPQFEHQLRAGALYRPWCRRLRHADSTGTPEQRPMPCREDVAWRRDPDDDTGQQSESVA